MEYSALKTIPVELLAHIFGYIPNRDINKIIPNRELLNMVEAVPAYWKYSTETLLRKYLKDVPLTNWKKVYQKLVKYRLSFSRLASAGEDGAVAVLLRAKDISPEKCDYAIVSTSMNGKSKMVKLLLENGRGNPATADNYAIIVASENGHEKVVKLLLGDKRVNPAASNNMAIILASKYGNTKVVKLLLADKRVNPGDVRNKAVRQASKYGHVKVVKLLLADERLTYPGVKL